MSAKYQKGRKVSITPVRNSPLQRDAHLEQYSNKFGVITDVHWIQPTGGEIFYIYTVLIEDENKEIVVHEDELEPHLK